MFNIINKNLGKACLVSHIGCTKPKAMDTIIKSKPKNIKVYLYKNPKIKNNPPKNSVKEVKITTRVNKLSGIFNLYVSTLNASTQPFIPTLKTLSYP